MKKQKDTFLESEGDAWHARNDHQIKARRLPDDDHLLQELLRLVGREGTQPLLRVLEIGCGDGTRLEWIRNTLPAQCFGVEPSSIAVASAKARGLAVSKGTADLLPIESQSVDVLIFGFCLYLCDREDLFRIASEADRVLRSPGWLLIQDFFSPAPTANPYKHHPGIYSHKMDYRRLFEWHPDYVCMKHSVTAHGSAECTDEADDWVAISVLRKLRRVTE